MANLNGFNANNVDPATDFEPIPAGKYVAIITDSGMKPTKSGSGHFLELTFQIIDGPYKSRMLWSRLNLDNPNAQAVQIAQGEGLDRAPQPPAPDHGEVQEARGHRGRGE